MAVKVRLNDGINLVVRGDLAGFSKRYEHALKHDEPMEVENGSGKMRILNPGQILYFEDASEGAYASGDSDPAAVPPDGLPVQ
jgi:hypothetical protein